MTSIIAVEGIGEVYGKQLQDIGIRTTEALLKKGATPKGRKEIGESTGISHSQILRWVNHVDLFRIVGVATQYAELLEAAGVDTVPELAQRNPDNLYQTLADVNAEKKLVRRIPPRSFVANWVQQASALERVITY